jgi:hypothetical protein
MNVIEQIREPDNMRISRVLWPKLPTSLVLRLIYSQLADTMNYL